MFAVNLKRDWKLSGNKYVLTGNNWNVNLWLLNNQDIKCYTMENDSEIEWGT